MENLACNNIPNYPTIVALRVHVGNWYSTAMMSEKMNRLGVVSFALGMLLAGCEKGSAAGSLLIGEWKLASGSYPACSIDGLVFTPRTYTEHIVAIGPKPAYQETHSIAYDWEAPNKAIVTGQGTGAGSEVWIIQDKDHAYAAENDTCRYVRVK